MRSPRLLAAILWLGVLPAAPAQEVLVGFEQASGARPPPPWQVVAGRRHRSPQFDVVEQEGRRLLMVYAAEAEGRLEHPLELGGSPGLRLSWRWRVDEHPRGTELGSDQRDDHALRLCARIEPDPERPGERGARGLALLLGGGGQSLCYHWDPELPAGQLAWSADGNTRILVLRGAETAPGSWQVETRDLFEDFRAQFGGEPRRLTMLWVSARTAGTRARSLAYLADLRVEPGG